MNRFEEQVEGTGSGTTQATSFQATCLMPWTMPALVYLGSSHVLVPPQLIYAAAYEKSRLAVGRHVARAHHGSVSMRSSAARACLAVSGSTVIWLTTRPATNSSSAHTRCGRSMRFIVEQ